MAFRVVQTLGVDKIIWMGMIDEIFYLLNISFLVLGLILIINFRFDIEEYIAPLSAALPTMALVMGSASVSV